MKQPYLTLFGVAAMSTNPDISPAVTGRRRSSRRRLGLMVTGLGAGLAAVSLDASLAAMAVEAYQDMNDRSH
jgi:hypothetical protein